MLTVKNINKIYPNGIHALNNVSLDISAGMFGLLGPNGAGKSSLMRTLASLQIPDSGQVKFNGLDVFSHPGKLRQQLGYLPQDFGVYPNMSAYKLLEHFAILKGLNNEQTRSRQIEQLLALTNLTKVKDKSVHTYSGGMMRRFGIAQALLGDPALIIVDEPTAGLDPEERNHFHLLLNKLAQNKVIILSTHIVEDISDLCSDIAILIAGQIRVQGRPETLINSLSRAIWEKSINPEDEINLRKKFKVISTRLIREQLIVKVLSEKSPGTDFKLVTPKLEDVYFSVLHYPQDQCLHGLFRTHSEFSQSNLRGK